MALLQDKIVLVNGGSQRVGAGIVRAAVREGATVVFTGRRVEVGEKLAADTGALFVQQTSLIRRRQAPPSYGLWTRAAASTAWSTRLG